MDLELSIPTNSAYDENGFLSVQTDGFGPNASAPHGHTHYPFGFYARPLDPIKGENGDWDPDQSGDAWHGYEGGELHIWPTFNPRYNAALPVLSKGGSFTFGGPPATPGYAVWDGETGAYRVHIPTGANAVIECGSVKIKVDATGVKIGSDAAQTVALAPGLLTYFTALETLLTTLAAAIDAKLIPTPGVNAGVVTAAMSAFTAARTAMQATLTKAT